LKDEQAVGNFYMLKIVFTGPESSGKSTLAALLAEHLDTNWVKEYARYFLQHLGREYVEKDLSAIAKGQLLLEQQGLAQAEQQKLPILICDTDWTVLHIWESYRFRQQKLIPTAAQWQTLWQQKAIPPAHYFLCAPDFPWQEDPLREHPEERNTLFEWYEQLLQTARLPYTVLRGGVEERMLVIRAYLEGREMASES
jgi:nicotinamide riboside kinase